MRTKLKFNYNLTLLLISAWVFVSCADDEPTPDLPKPTATDIEIGLNNNKQGIVGRDFHFNAEVIAGDKIADVQIRILQKSNETYSAAWEFEIIWDEYKGVKNANIHKHFDMPEDAPEGVYDFYFIVNDQNGTSLEVREDFTVVNPVNLAVGLSIKNHGYPRL